MTSEGTSAALRERVMEVLAHRYGFPDLASVRPAELLLHITRDADAVIPLITTDVQARIVDALEAQRWTNSAVTWTSLSSLVRSLDLGGSSPSQSSDEGKAGE